MSIISDGESEKPQSDTFNDLVIMYRAMVDAMRQGQKMIEEGTYAKFDRVRYKKLELKCDSLWPKLSHKEHVMAVEDLIRSGHMSSPIAEMLIYCNGTISTEQPKEPCWSV